MKRILDKNRRMEINTYHVHDGAQPLGTCGSNGGDDEVEENACG